MGIKNVYMKIWDYRDKIFIKSKEQYNKGAIGFAEEYANDAIMCVLSDVLDIIKQECPEVFREEE